MSADGVRTAPLRAPSSCAPNAQTGRQRGPHFSDLEAEAPGKASDLSQRTWDTTPSASDSKDRALLVPPAPSQRGASTEPHQQLGQVLQPEDPFPVGPGQRPPLCGWWGLSVCLCVSPSGQPEVLRCCSRIGGWGITQAQPPAAPRPAQPLSCPGRG